MKSRRCILSISVFSALIALSSMASAATFLERDGTVLRLGNGLITTTFDLAGGQWEASYDDGTVFASELKCTVYADEISSTDKGLPTFSISRIRNDFGKGLQLEMKRGIERPFDLLLSMYDEKPFFLVQVRLPDASGLRIKEVTLPEGKIYVGADTRNVCVVANYWNGQWHTEIHPVDITERRNRWDTYSHFYLCAYNRADEKSVTLGALYSKGKSMIEAEVDPERDPGALFFRSRCYFEKNALNVEDDTWESPPYIVCAPGNVFDGLEAYGAAARAYRPGPELPAPPTGWCSWNAGASESQDEVYANIDAIKANRLDEYGLRYVQLDDGWQLGWRCSGQWWPRLRRFPDGMKGAADYIRSNGFVPGIWIGPFGEDAGQRNQKELFASPQSNGYDLSNPQFKEYLGREMRRLVEDWGFRYIKADFLTYGQTASATAPYDVSFREALQSMQKALAPYGGYLLTCINHEWLSVGFTDGQRLGNDVRGGALTGLYPTLKTWPRRYFSNNNFWVGHPDMLHVNLPTDEQSQAWASFVALSGGATMSGDSIHKLPASRIDILKKALPAQAITARPCDLFERPPGWAPRFPRIWDCKISKPTVGAWDVVGLFNWTDDHATEASAWPSESQNISLDFAKRLQLNSAKRYLAYDFWRQEYLGAFENGLQVALPPGTCRVIVLREELNIPQVLGDDRHIVSGAQCIKNLRWDEPAQTLSGLIETVKDIQYSLAIHLPSGLALHEATANGAPANVWKSSDHSAKITFSTGNGKVDLAVVFKSARTQPEPTASSLISRINPPAPEPGESEIVLRNLRPLWTDQRHDIECDPIAARNHADLGAVAPFWICWDIAKYSARPRRLVSECVSTGDGKVFFEVLGDGKRLYASDTLQKGQTAAINVRVDGVKELTLVCHYVEGWFSAVKGCFKNPRLALEKAP